jgi:arylsulfatase A-like enzyme
MSFSACDSNSEKTKSERPPNVVFIICDDLNDAIEGMGGHPQAITPNIDKLMNNGVQFTNAQTNVPLCGPSRASLWSGLLPTTTGFYGFKQQQNHWRNNSVLKNTVTLFEQLSKNGYDVYATGKIHHNGHEDKSIFKNTNGKNGFSVNPSFGPYPWNSDPATNNVKDRGVFHPDMPKSMWNIKNCWKSFGPVKDLSNTMGGKGSWIYNHNEEEFHVKSDNNRDLMPDERCVVYTKEILSQKHEEPFFMAVGFNRPHAPLNVPQKYFDMFPLETLKLPKYLKNDIEDCASIYQGKMDLGDGGQGFSSYKGYYKHGGEDMLLKWTQAYLACVAFVDEQIGEVVKAIEKSPYANNTLIVLTSDHGYQMGEKEYIFKNSLWEESARIPFVVAGLNAEKGKVCTAPISLIDVYPTILDYCNIDKNPNANGNEKSLDGHSLQPLIVNPKAGIWNGNPYAVTAVSSAESLNTDEPGKISDQHFSIRSEKYRYILYRNGEEELYDHEIDPYEWKNVARDKKYKKVKAQMKRYVLEAKKEKV